MGELYLLCEDPRCYFDVAVKDNGGIKFKYKKALSFEDHGTSVRSYRDIHFTGKLSATGFGKGSFSSSGCVGSWSVQKWYGLR